jgi:type I restriction enzyme S subunit
MFRLINGCAFKPEDWKQNGTPIIRIQNLNDPNASFNYSQAPIAERNRVEAGDLLFAWSGTIGTSFGARVWAGPSGVLNQHIFKVHMDEQQITLPFSLLVFARIEEAIAKQAHGFKASFVHVKKSDLVKVSLPVPSLPEQRAIAEALSDVDGLLGGLDRLIAKKRDLKQAAMQQLLTGQTRLPGFHGEWVVKALGDLGSIYGGLTGKTKTDFGEVAGRYVTFMNVMTNVVIDTGIFERVKVSPTESQNRVLKGDLLFNGSSETPEEVAMCAVLNEDVPNLFLNSFCFGFRFRDGAETDGLFMAYHLRSKEGRELMKSLAQGSTRYNLSKAALLKSPLRLPTLPEQTAIAVVLSDMDAELAALEQRREKTRALKQAMMQELLTGRTRLV